MDNQAVIVRFVYLADSLDPLFELERRLEAVVAAAGVGEHDGYDAAADLSDGTLYLYGPDADALFEAIRPTLAGADCLRAARATLRYGPPKDGVPSRVVSVDAEPGDASQ